jgi:hypothetical protein
MVFVAGYVAASASAMNQSTSKEKGYDDRPFLCAAVFRILMEGHLDPAEKDDHNRFKTRFDALYALGKDSLARIGGTDDKAREVVQTYIYLAGSFAIKKKEKIGELVLYCERIYKAAVKMGRPL